MYDVGQATPHMMLAAADLGIGSGHSAVVDQGQAQRVLGFPGGYRAVFMIGLGYPADRPLRPFTSPNRRPFDEVGTAGSTRGSRAQWALSWDNLAYGSRTGFSAYTETHAKSRPGSLAVGRLRQAWLAAGHADPPARVLRCG